MNILHIFNGDSSFASFKHTTLKGETIVWREMLVEGPVSYELCSSEFWNLRSTYFKEEYFVEYNEFYTKSMHPWESITLSNFNEIILWFEYDLFCRMNFFALLSFLYQQKITTKISIPDLRPFQSGNIFIGLGELSPNLFPELFVNRESLSDFQIMWADQFWKLYSNNLEIKPALDFLMNSEPYFIHLDNTIESLSRLVVDNRLGLDQLDKLLLSKVNHSGPISKNELIRTLFLEFPDMGFGDTQYERRIRKLESFFLIQDGMYEIIDESKNLLRKML